MNFESVYSGADFNHSISLYFDGPLQNEVMRHEWGGHDDPEKPPRPERGDIFILLGLAGGVIGGVYLARAVNNFLVILGCAVAGLAIGIVISAYIRRRHRKKSRQMRGEIRD